MPSGQAMRPRRSRGDGGRDGGVIQFRAVGAFGGALLGSARGLFAVFRRIIAAFAVRGGRGFGFEVVAGKGIAGLGGAETRVDLGGVVFGELEADEMAVELFGDDQGGSASAEGIEDG